MVSLSSQVWRWIAALSDSNSGNTNSASGGSYQSGTDTPREVVIPGLQNKDKRDKPHVPGVGTSQVVVIPGLQDKDKRGKLPKSGVDAHRIVIPGPKDKDKHKVAVQSIALPPLTTHHKKGHLGRGEWHTN